MSEPEGVPRETREDIMEATFRALNEHGYSDLRMRDIGAEMEKTRQVIHYHYDGKYDLLSKFLEYVIDQYEGSVEVERDAPPREELDARIQQCLLGPEFEGFGHWERMRVYHELFTNAQNDEQFREIFDDHYDRMRGSITEVIEDGIEQGVFRDVDAKRVGQLITDLIHATRGRKLALGHDDAPERAMQSIDEFVIDSLVVEE